MNDDDATLHDGTLRETARRLGTRAAERLDVERTARAVVARLRAEPRARVRVFGWIRPAWVRIAAVLVMVVGGGAIVRSLSDHQPGAPALTTTAGVELSDLSAAQLRQLLEAVGTPDMVASPDVSLEDLSPLELRALLESLEG